MKIFTLLISSTLIFANETFFRQNHFKNSNKISSRSLTINGELLKQSYDDSGKLRIEIYSKGRVNESICIDSKNQKHFASSSTNSENYFKCLSEYSQVVKKNGGEVEEPPRENQKTGDLNLNSRGKNLK